MALALLSNNAMTFTENQHRTAILEKLWNQRESARCCDVILHVAGLQFQAHRCVLAACSPYFDSIFKASKTVKEQLTVSSQHPDVFLCLLAYMYRGTVVVDRTKVAELLRLANKLLLAKLKEHCSEYLQRYLDTTNCIAVKDMATKYNLEALEKTAGLFISAHLSEVIEGEEVLEFSHSRLEDFLRCRHWKVDESQTLVLVTRWVHHAAETRERNLRSLLTWVQWPDVDPQIANQLIQTHPLYTSTDSNLALFFLLDALNEHAKLSTDFFTLFSKLKDKFCQSTDSVVDNESFYSLAITTAIDELQDDPIKSVRNQECLDVTGDLCINTSPPMHPIHSLSQEVKDDTGTSQLIAQQSHIKINDFLVATRRGCDTQENHISDRIDHSEQEVKQCSQYYSSQNMHANQPSSVYSQTAASTSNLHTYHSHTSEDSIGETTSTENEKFAKNNPINDGQLIVKNMTVWHQEPPYGKNESLSSDSTHILYQRQVYDQNFSLKPSCPDSYDKRVPVISSDMFSVRENSHKQKQNFSNSVSYYVSTYNPEEELTVSDDQSVQSFYNKFNSGMNFYSCRVADMKENLHAGNESHHNHENYIKSYYHTDVEINKDRECNNRIKQDTECRKSNIITKEAIECNQQQDIYYGENSTDTQISNCPQDMTIQHQVTQQQQQQKQQTSNVKQETIDSDSQETSLKTVPDRLLDYDAHFEHHNIKNDDNDVKLKRDMNECEELALTVGLTRVEFDETLMADGKRSPLHCSGETRGIFTIIGGRVMEDNFYTTGSCGSDSKNATLDEFVLPSTYKSNQENCSFNTQENCSEEEKCSTSQQIKFKITHTFTQESSPCNINTTINTPSCTSQAGGVLDFSHLESENVDPDDPHPIYENFEEQVSKQKQIYVLEKEATVNNKSEKLKKQGRKEKTRLGNSDISECELQLTGRGDNPEQLSEATVINKQEPVRRTSGTVKSGGKKKGITKCAVATKERVCELCQESFTQTRKYFVHMKDHFPGPPHHCDTCDSSFKTIYHLLDHRGMHQDLRAHKCPHCPFSTRKKFNLTEHLIQHFDNKKFKCKICGVSFSREQVLQVHETSHTNERPFLCDICGWSGKTKNALITHTKIHTGEVLRCQVSGCSYSTPKKSHLKEHMQSHSNCRSYVCNICSKSFITNSHLKRHMKIHLQEKLFKCPQCDYGSLRKDCLKVHIEKKHTQKPVKTVARKRTTKKKSAVINVSQNTEETCVTPQIRCSQADLLSDLENTNISLQPQLPGTPPPTTLSEYPASPTYAFPTQASSDDPLVMVPDMNVVTEGFTHLPDQAYEGSYHSPRYQTSPSHFAVLSPTHTALSYSSGHHQEESPLNFTDYMKYD